MNKRLLALLSVLILATMVLSACGPGKPAAAQSEPAATEAPAADTDGPIFGPTQPPTHDQAPGIYVHVCVVTGMDEAPNNIAPIMDGNDKIGEIIYAPTTGYVSQYVNGSFVQSGDLNNNQHVVIGVGINDQYVIATELAACNDQLYFTQAAITPEEWEQIPSK